MRKTLLLSVILLRVIISPAQGVYQLWGMTQYGGINDLGVVFSTNAAGDNFELRHQFSEINLGAKPESEMVEYNGKFYGMTSAGGDFNAGTGGIINGGVIFEWDPATNYYTRKMNFINSIGADPYGSLTLKDNKFYGMTNSGGINNQGVIFEWDPSTNIYTKKFDFDFYSGSFPYGNLTLYKGKFYGMTSRSEGLGGPGEIFEWDPSTNIFSPKVKFNGDNGKWPDGSLTLIGDQFYGMTANGGLNGAGVLFEWDPATNIYTKKIDLNYINGSEPSGNLTQKEGKLYGMTTEGGSNGVGVIFEWDPATNGYTKRIDLNMTDGASPVGSLTLDSNKFYGMTAQGGSNNVGVIFEWDPVTNQYAKKTDLTNINGGIPHGDLTLSQGNFYGLTLEGGLGTNSSGVIFEWNPASNVYTKKIDLNFSTSYHPSGSLTMSNGKLYGMTTWGGNNNNGVIFELDPATNGYTKKIDLQISDGGIPDGNSLTLYGGNFYGMTTTGGSNSVGVIFEWNPVANIYAKKFDFDSVDGSTPHGNLTFYGGKFYGMTQLGGSNNVGVIFEWDPAANRYVKKIDLNTSTGSYPFASLTLSDGKFYGIAPVGGSHSSGVIFEWDPATNAYSRMINFFPGGDYGDGGSGNLVQSGSKFYGITNSGQAPWLFEWDKSQNLITHQLDLYTDMGISSGCGFTASGNKLYSMTGRGGKNDQGVIFEWDPATYLYTKKLDFNMINGAYPGAGNGLTLAPVPVATGVSGSCISFPPVTIDSSNNHKWVPITDSSGNAVAEINASGNNLGKINTSVFINNALVREDGNKRLYLDRNLTLTPQVQPTNPVDIRLYIKGSEFLALKNAINSKGDSSRIRSINDIVVYTNENDCSPATTVLNDTLPTKAEAWEADYVLTASTSSFSSFYFAGKAPFCAGPIIQCKADTLVNLTDHHCGALLRFNQPAVTDACGVPTVTQITGLHSGAFFPIGNTTNTFVATDSSGKTDTCSFTVTVKDTEPPSITPVWAFPEILWPPNHKMKDVDLYYYGRDNCGSASCSLDVSSDEPLTGTGYGDQAPDWSILDNHHIQLRAEREGHGHGRTYTITVSCKDSSGNTSIQKTKVVVPFDLHTRYSKGNYSFGGGVDGYIDANGDYIDQRFTFKLTPNPSSNYFEAQMQTSSNEKIEMELYDISGRFLSKMDAVQNQVIRFGNDLRPGIYLLEIIQGQERHRIKVVKQ